MGTLITIHGELRWLVVLAAVVVIIKFLIGWLGKRNYASVDRTLLTVLTILLDINVLLGLVILLFGGGFTGPRLEHATTMILAAIAAHMTAIWRKSSDSSLKYRNQLFMVLLAVVLVIFGVIRLRGGFMF
jgi:CDP-diglyceride synthetase